MNNGKPLIERRHLACNTCKSSYEVCPECGLRLAHRIIKSKLYCIRCNEEMVYIKDVQGPSCEVMGQDGHFIGSMFQCPKCSLAWSTISKDNNPVDRYVKSFEDQGESPK